MPCAIFRAVSNPPPNLKIKRVKVVVDDASVKRLTERESRGDEKYIAEGRMVRDECKGRPKHKRAK